MLYGVHGSEMWLEAGLSAAQDESRYPVMRHSSTGFDQVCSFLSSQSNCLRKSYVLNVLVF